MMWKAVTVLISILYRLMSLYKIHVEEGQYLRARVYQEALLYKGGFRGVSGGSLELPLGPNYFDSLVKFMKNQVSGKMLKTMMDLNPTPFQKS